MPRFFVDKDSISGGYVNLFQEDAKHLSLSLRVKIGEDITICDKEGTDYLCKVCDVTKNQVKLEICDTFACDTEPSVFVTLYQSLIKADKFESVIQKSVELGVSRIVPVLTQRCISRPDNESMAKKIDRWNKIAKEAAMQSGRGIIPEVLPVITYNEALGQISQNDLGFICYEAQPHIPLMDIYNKGISSKGSIKNMAFLIGPEGGIADQEAKKAIECGIPLASLGKRILRTETAPLCVLSAIMLLTGNLN